MIRYFFTKRIHTPFDSASIGFIVADIVNGDLFSGFVAFMIWVVISTVVHTIQC